MTTKKRKKKKKKTMRVLLSLLTSQLIGCIFLPWLQFALKYPPTVSLLLTVLITVFLALVLVTSKLARCSAAIHLCSCASPKGQVGVILIISGLLVAGPIKNIYSNLILLSKFVMKLLLLTNYLNAKSITEFFPVTKSTHINLFCRELIHTTPL